MAVRNAVETLATQGEKAEVLRHLKLIEGSEAFDGAPVARSLLRHIVEETLEGRRPKELSIALSVLGKTSSIFDPKKDRAVSVHVGRIRECLKRYYSSQGRTDPVVISIPKGSYTASVEFRTIILPPLRPSPLVLSTNPLVPAGLYAATVAIGVDTEFAKAASYLCLPKVFSPWLLCGREKDFDNFFITAMDSPFRRDPYGTRVMADFEEQIIRIYRDSDWDAIRKQLPPDILRLAEGQGRWVPPMRSREFAELDMTRTPLTERRCDYVAIDVEHIIPYTCFLPEVEQAPDLFDEDTEGDYWFDLDLKRQLSYCGSLNCYAWFETDHVADHIAFCACKLYHRLAP